MTSIHKKNSVKKAISILEDFEQQNNINKHHNILSSFRYTHTTVFNNKNDDGDEKFICCHVVNVWAF